MKTLKIGKKRVAIIDEKTRNEFVLRWALIKTDIETVIEHLETMKTKYGKDNPMFCDSIDRDISILELGDHENDQLYEILREL